MKVTTAAFPDGGAIPRVYTCEGEDRSPSLAWSEVPPETKSFALILDDPDAPMGTFTHWLLWDIPGDQRTLDEGIPKQATWGPMKQGRNDFHKIGYGGPCPPRGHGVHRYQFHLYALTRDRLGLPGGASRAEMEAALRGCIIAEAQLTGTYERR